MAPTVLMASFQQAPISTSFCVLSSELVMPLFLSMTGSQTPT
jgi:hypothetical protein